MARLPVAPIGGRMLPDYCWLRHLHQRPSQPPPLISLSPTPSPFFVILYSVYSIIIETIEQIDQSTLKMHNPVFAAPVVAFNPKMDRQLIIEANRSLRLIKNELEALLEKGVLTEDAFDSINQLLPTESSISASGNNRATAIPSNGVPTPVSSTPSSPPVSAALNRLNLHDTHHNEPAGAPPPSYTQSTAGGGPPPLPGRKQPPAPPPPVKPVLVHAKALYAYAASDARDCSFERDDRIAVYEYMNADWWMGRNLRTGQEGIFPKSYVEQEQAASVSSNGWNNEKATTGGGYVPPSQPQYGSGPPAQMNPYNAHAPPQAMADQQQGSGKEGTGKKIGKKLGNAAIFGAGATIGSNIVNSIF
ncbi:hypothetical protein B0H66DRAFT_527820 [Apodospora peruviana]|uniref:SH3 domain-containing protein n=1 Tax=Apodospora peruviana TaxID=516989 RepID=A0AAE0MFB4_9PEZI|nr:hypothetical protein B0H66DRAFT_527820 [Apodospora peruviana]